MATRIRVTEAELTKTKVVVMADGTEYETPFAELSES